jgi:GNAT superfamily N-acetyltransferase
MEHHPLTSGQVPPAPARLTEVAKLRDGSHVTLRPVRRDDWAPLQVFLEGLCPEARRLRFFSGAADAKRAARWAAEVAPGHVGLLVHDEQGMVVGHAAFAKLDGSRAEVALEVADHLHGRGLGTLLIARLAAIAERRHIATFVAEVLPENRAMLDVFRHAFQAHVSLRDGADLVDFPTSSWRRSPARPPR